MNGFDFYFPYEYLKAALTVSLLSVWVLVGLFQYLNRYTTRAYFKIWTAAWLFYAIWISLFIYQQGAGPNPWVMMFKQWSVGAAAIFLIWGSVRFLKQDAPFRMVLLFLGFLLVWSYVGAFVLKNEFWFSAAIFNFIGIASEITGWAFYRLRKRREFLGAGLLSFGFVLWGVTLSAHPFLESSKQLVSAGFFISAIIQLFIAVSMIVLVLEEVRSSNLQAWEAMKSQKHETEILRLKVVSTEARYRSLFDQASEGIVIASSDDLQILEMNQTAKRLLGLLSENPKGHFNSFCQFTNRSPENCPSAASEWFHMLEQEHRLNIIKRDGASIPAEVHGSSIQYDGKRAFQFFIRELTERARLEQQLRQVEKLSALGQMISGIAHELNNPLAVIKGYAELILGKHDISRQTRTDLERVAHESNRATKLVQNFLTFARERPLSRVETQINEVISSALVLRQFDLRVSGVKLEESLDPRLPKTLCDADQVEQVLINLIQNALHALVDKPGAGLIRITSAVREGHIRVRVEDNGAGIPPEVLPHIFEPFYTTKQVGTGTGLGLSIAHSIITDHQGKIFHERSRLGGAAFVIDLPICVETKIACAPALTSTHTRELPMIFSSPPTTESHEPKPHARILILDDEVSIAELLGEMLNLLGHSPVLCNSPVRALEILQQQDFDVILSDFRMPAMNGQQFYQTATARRPDLARRIVFLTGDVVNEETQAFLETTGNPHLSKPFQLGSVEQVVERILDQSTAAFPA